MNKQQAKAKIKINVDIISISEKTIQYLSYVFSLINMLLAAFGLYSNANKLAFGSLLLINGFVLIFFFILLPYFHKGIKNIVSHLVLFIQYICFYLLTNIMKGNDLVEYQRIILLIISLSSILIFSKERVSFKRKYEWSKDNKKGIWLFLFSSFALITASIGLLFLSSMNVSLIVKLFYISIALFIVISLILKYSIRFLDQ